MDFNDLVATIWPVLLWSAGFIGVFFCLYSRRILSIFDPLVVLAVAQAAYCVMAVALIHSPLLLIQFFASQAALVVGFLLVPTPRLRAGQMVWTNRDIRIAEYTVFLLFLLILFANIWLGTVTGFPALSNDPSSSKVSVYAGGLGLVRRINSGVGIFVPAGALLLAIRGKHKAIFGMVFGVCAILATLSGSKGALLIFLQIIGYVVYRRDLISNRVTKRLQFISIVFVVASVFLGVAVLYVVTQDWSLATGGFLRRILLQGDVIIYYYDPRVFPHFASLGPLDYVYMLLNPVLGAVRLVPYQFPLGFQMVTYYLGNPYASEFAFGPNTPFFVVGHAYFGSFFGVIYCGAVGYLVARLRSLFLEAQNVSPLRLIWLLALAVLVYSLPVEVNLFTSPLMDMSVMVLVAVMAAHSFLFILKSAPREMELLSKNSV